MPDQMTPGADLHKGSYQVGTAPKTLKQKAKEQQQVYKARAMQSSGQKVKSFAPGDAAIRAKIKAAGSGPVSFSDQE